MTRRKLHATAFLTVRDQYVPLNTPSTPGIDEQLIEEEEKDALTSPDCYDHYDCYDMPPRMRKKVYICS